MLDYRDFTYDPTRYSGLPQFVEELHNMSKKWVPILDAGISARAEGVYSVYDSGKENNVFIEI